MLQFNSSNMVNLFCMLFPSKYTRAYREKKLKASRIMKIIIVLSETREKNHIINIQNNDRVRLILMGIFHNIGIQYSLDDLTNYSVRIC